jgi:hypothetical protein
VPHLGTDAGRVDANENLVGCRRRRRDLVEPEDVG